VAGVTEDEGPAVTSLKSSASRGRFEGREEVVVSSTLSTAVLVVLSAGADGDTSTVARRRRRCWIGTIGSSSSETAPMLTSSCSFWNASLESIVLEENGLGYEGR
jgi:hypothetical protein